MAGVFISFEGGEGSGKSTQIALLANWLSQEWPGGITTTREPGGTKEAERIRDLLVKNDNNWDSTTEALLMTAARRQNIAHVIKPALARGEAVLTDRFFDSTTVYQGCAGGVDEETIKLLNNRFLDGVYPDITILLDIEAEQGLERSVREDNSETRFEDLGLAYHKKVREGFLMLAKQEPERFIVIDANQNEMAIHEQIKAAITPLLEVFRRDK